MRFGVPCTPRTFGMAAVMAVACIASAFTPPHAFHGSTKVRLPHVFGVRLRTRHHAKATLPQEFHTSSTKTSVSSLIQIMDSAGLCAYNKPINLYQVLGASVEDSPAVLKKKYLALAKKSHPDIITRDLAIDFSEVAAAYAILSDPVQRRKYDRQLLANDWIEAIFYLLSGLADFFVIFLQLILWPLSRELFQGVVSATITKDKQHMVDSNDWFFATIA